MSVQPIDFPRLLRLWPSNEKNKPYNELAADMGVPSSRARQWLNRNYLPPCYWPRFASVLAEKFGLVITQEQLVEASCFHGEKLSARGRRAAETRKRKRESDNAPDCGKSPENEIEKDARG
jgi:hypothetical protein